MSDFRSFLFGDSDDKKLQSSNDIWGNSSNDDLFSESRSSTFSPKRKKISDILEEIETTPSLNQNKKNEQKNINAISINLQDNNDNIIKEEDPLLNPLLNPLLSLSIQNNDNNDINILNEQTNISINDKNEILNENNNSLNIFEQFIVVGFPSCKDVSPSIVTSKLESKILYQYPEKSKLPLTKISKFCFPDGIYAKRIEKSSTTLNELFYGQQYLHNASTSFIFLLTGNNSKPYYGICVTKDEPIEDLPEYVGGPSSFMKIGKSPDKYITVAPRVYCIISQYPFFSLHYDILYGIVAHEKLIRMSTSFDINSTSSISNLLINNNEILHLLSLYYNATIPNPGQTFTLKMPYEHKDLSFYNPLGDNISLIYSRWCFITLFRTLSLSSIIQILSAILQETQIVFVSKNLGLLSNIILSIIPMIRPLDWQGLLVPILPQSLKETLNAPVPYICGVVDLSSNQVNQLVKNNALIVYINGDSVRLPPNFKLIPDARKLTEKLLKYQIQIRNIDDSIDNPYMTYQEYSSISDIITKVFFNYNSWLLNNICKNFMGINANDFEKRDNIKTTYISKISTQNRLFVTILLDSQCFNNFLDSYIRTHE